MVDGRLLERVGRSWRLPGVVACGFDEGGMEVRSWGVREVEGGRPMTERTVFPIASVTKTFTAELLLRAARAGRVEMDAPIGEQLPGFGLADGEASAEMTPRDAACHFSGLPPHTWAWVYGDCTRRAFVRERLPHLASVGPFRESHRYSNVLYAVLGALVEERGEGVDWETLLEREILGPLSMASSGVLTEEWWRLPDMAQPYAGGERSRRIPRFFAKRGHLIAPASEMFASVPDLARWGQAMLRLDPEEERWRACNRVEGERAAVLGELHYGLGWRLDAPLGRRRVWHSGQCSGYSVLLSLWPEEGRGRVFAANRSGAVDALHALDVAAASGLDPLEVFPAAVPPQENRTVERKAAAPDALPEGDYWNPGYGPLRVRRREDGLRVRFQEAVEVPVEREETGGVGFALSEYGVWFRVTEKWGGLVIPFEPAAGPICFRPV